MPSIHEIGLPIPPSYQEFESIVCDYFSNKFSNEFQKYGVQGQNQDGIDLIWNNIGVQCKNYQKTRLTETKLEADISRAETIIPQLSHLFIVTTAPRDVKIQNYINNRSRKFPIEIFYWDVIENFLMKNPQIKNLYYPVQQSDTDEFVCIFLERCIKYSLYDIICNNDFISTFRAESFCDIDNLKEELKCLVNSKASIRVDKNTLNDVLIMISHLEYITHQLAMTATPNINGVSRPRFPDEKKEEIEKQILESRNEICRIYLKYKFE